MAKIRGTPETETLEGTPDGDIFKLLGGDDIVAPLAGDDEVKGSKNGGNVLVLEEPGPDSGNDSFNFKTGFNIVWAGSGDDDFRGGSGNDEFHGESGNDRAQGRGGNDVLDGGDGNDWLDGGKGDDRLISGEGYDVLNDKKGDNVYVLSKTPENDEPTALITRLSPGDRFEFPELGEITALVSDENERVFKAVDAKGDSVTFEVEGSSHDEVWQAIKGDSLPNPLVGMNENHPEDSPVATEAKPQDGQRFENEALSLGDVVDDVPPPPDAPTPSDPGNIFPAPDVTALVTEEHVAPQG